MINKGKNKQILQVRQNIVESIEGIQTKVQKNIGAIYKGSQLVWLTIYNVIKNCFNSGIWLGDKPWIGNDSWKNNN